MIVIRKAMRQDDAALAQIDASIETPIIYKVVQTGEGFALERAPVDPPLGKQYAMATFRQMAPPCDREWIAQVNGRPVGFIGTAIQDRHKRCTVWHLYVDKAHRRQGIGRRLMDKAEAEARKSGAELLWVETQNVNAPAIAAYRALGFELVGLDTTLYHGTAEAGEIAIFLARRLGDGRRR